MIRLYSTVILILLLAIALSINHLDPLVFSDSNKFLGDYIGPQFLATLGFIVSITLTGTNNLYVNIQRLSKEKELSFKRTRKALRNSAYSLIGLFAFAILVVLAKHSDYFTRLENWINLIALAIIYMNISILIDITTTALNLPD